MNVLDGKITVVVGGTNGIGARTAALFVAEGATVVLGGQRRLAGDEWAATLGARARVAEVDVTAESQVKTLIDDTVHEFGRLDVLVNNAGIGGQPTTSWDAIYLDTFWAVVAVHVRGVVAAIKHAAPVMIAQRSGSIVNTASVVGLIAGWTGADYSAAKAAVIQLTGCAAIELGQHGIRVNSVSPGPIPTGIFGKAGGMHPEAADRCGARSAPASEAMLSSNEATRRVSLADDVARALLWLASDASSFVNGQDIATDGGISAGRPIAVSIEERRNLRAAFASLT